MKSELKTGLAEKLEKQRYRGIFGQTLSYAVWFGALIALLLVNNVFSIPEWILLAFTGLMILGFVPFVIYTFKLAKVTKLIMQDSEIRSAVNNEMYLANDRKAGVWGYYMTLFAAFAVFLISYYTNISAVVATAIILYTAALSARFAQLVIHRG